MKVNFMPAYGFVAPSLPTWNFQGVGTDCVAGCFTADAANSLNTTQVQISSINQAGSDSSWMSAVTINGTIAMFRDNQGRTAAFGLESLEAVPEVNAPEAFLLKLMLPVGNIDWQGGYSLTFLPAQ